MVSGQHATRRAGSACWLPARCTLPTCRQGSARAWPRWQSSCVCVGQHRGPGHGGGSAAGGGSHAPVPPPAPARTAPSPHLQGAGTHGGWLGQGTRPCPSLLCPLLRVYPAAFVQPSLCTPSTYVSVLPLVHCSCLCLPAHPLPFPGHKLHVGALPCFMYATLSTKFLLFLWHVVCVCFVLYADRTTAAGPRMATTTARCSTLPRSTPALRRLPPARRPPPPPPTGRDPMPRAWTPRPAPHCCRRWWRPGSGRPRR